MGVSAGFLTVADGYYELDYMSSQGATRGLLDSLNLSDDFGFPVSGNELMVSEIELDDEEETGS